MIFLKKICRVSFEGEISSWVYVNYDVYHSGIIIFDGKVSKIGETDGENIFAISLVNSDFENPEIGQNIKFLHIEELMMNSEKPILKDSHYSVL